MPPRVLQATHTHELQLQYFVLPPNKKRLQATHTHELQRCHPRREWWGRSFKPRIRMSYNPVERLFVGQGVTFKPRIRMSYNCKNAQYSGSCTDYYVHILTFSSVLPARKERDLQPLSRFRDGKSPPILCEPAGFPCLLRLRTECFCDDFIDSLSGNIL